MIFDICNTQDKGKSLLGVVDLSRCIAGSYYHPDEVYSNMVISLPGSHIGTSEEIGECMVDMIKKKWLHKFFFVDEIDRLFPARWWNDKEQAHKLMGLLQDIKSFHRFVATRHPARSVDKIFRDAAQFVLVPNYRKESNCLDFAVINSLDLRRKYLTVPNVSRYFERYKRWEPID